MKHLITEMGVALFFLAALPALSAAENAPLVVGGVAVTADNISRDEVKEVLQAKGNVVAKWGGYSLFADTVLVRLADDEAFAEGKVILRKEGVDFFGDRVKINYVTQLGETGKGTLVVKSFAAGKGVSESRSKDSAESAASQRMVDATEQHNYTIRGDRFFKTGQDDYRIERGSFTTCEGDAPSWRFTASDLDLTLEEYAVGKNAVFYAGDMPLFYTPYILFPVMRERQSGFLFTTFGNSSKKGLNLDIPYYWAISPSQEATFDLDIQTKRGAGLGFDYRYLRPSESNGQVKGYIIYDTQKDQLRGDLTVKQQEVLSPSLKLTADLQLSSDRSFYRDYGEENGVYNRQMLDSTLFVTKNWTHSSLAFETRYVDDLMGDSNRQTLQKLPEITYTLTKTPIGTTPFYFGLDSIVTNFYEEDGARGQRLDLHPTLSYYLTFFPGIDFSLWGGYRQRYYSDYGADAGEKFGSRGEGLFDGSASLSAPLARVYPLGGSDLLAVRHSLIPELRYSLVEQKNQEGLPFFDYKDRVPGQQMFLWSLTNFLTGKYADAAGSPTYRDMFYFRLSQGYQLSGSRRDLLTQVDEGRRFTDIRLEARYALAKNLTANVDSRYNPYMTRFSTASLRLDADDGKGDLAGLGYQFAREQVQHLEGKINDRDRVQYLEGKVALMLVKPFVFKYTGRYSFEKKNFLESDYALEYRKQCWSLLLAYQDRLANKQLMISFTLAGIGSTGPMKAF
jgi:LPS-assembly protein